MKFLRLAKKNREVNPKSWDVLYEKNIEKRIRAKYSINAELAIIRQRDTKPEEFEEYNAYVERCKIEVKKEMEISTTN